MEVGKSAIIILMLLLYCGFMVFVTWLGHHRQKGQAEIDKEQLEHQGGAPQQIDKPLDQPAKGRHPAAAQQHQHKA